MNKCSLENKRTQVNISFPEDYLEKIDKIGLHLKTRSRSNTLNALLDMYDYDEIEINYSKFNTNLRIQGKYSFYNENLNKLIYIKSNYNKSYPTIFCFLIDKYLEDINSNKNKESKTLEEIKEENKKLKKENAKFRLMIKNLKEMINDLEDI